MGFNVTCTPGPDAAVAFMQVTPELPALVFYLDPVNMAIQLPAAADGRQVLAKLCRELAVEAAKLADHLETQEEIGRTGGGTGDAQES